MGRKKENETELGHKQAGGGDKADEIDSILKQRASTHGDYVEQAYVTQVLKNIIHGQRQWNDLNAPMRESLEMICHKIGRIMSGDPCTKDHWFDIAGYAKLIADKLPPK
jgi:hypothetical protein